MRTLDWYFDFVSPFAYLQWRRMGELPGGIEVRPRPVLFAGLLSHWGTTGPAELASKRAFTYRYALWRARRLGIPMRLPEAHPFNPLPALRLAIALDCRAEAVGAIFDFVWEQGRRPDQPAEFEALAEALGIEDAPARIAAPEVKAALRANTEEAIARGVFGVPTSCVGEDLFWGEDATGMVLDWLADREAFEDPEMRRAGALPIGTERHR